MLDGMVTAVMLQLFVAVPATESTTRTPKEVMDAPPTGPVITPVEGFSVIPEGSDPMMENV